LPLPQIKHSIIIFVDSVNNRKKPTNIKKKKIRKKNESLL